MARAGRTGSARFAGKYANVTIERIAAESPGLGFATLAFNNKSGLGQGGTGVLKVDGKVVATRTMERTIPVILQWDESFDVGADTGTPVDGRDYQLPFKFNGKLVKLTLTIDRPKLTPADEQRLTPATSRN